MNSLRTYSILILAFVSAIILLPVVSCDEGSTSVQDKNDEFPDTTGLHTKIELYQNAYTEELERLNDSLMYYYKLGVIHLEQRTALYAAYNQASNLEDKELLMSKIEANLKWGEKVDSLQLLTDESKEFLFELTDKKADFLSLKYSQKHVSDKTKQFKEITDFIEQSKLPNSVTRKETVSSRTKTE